MPYARRIFIERELKILIRLGIISEANPGECPYACRIVVVAKKDGTLRRCVDYRHLNQMTIKDAYPLPLIDDIFTSLHNSYYIAAVDLRMGYHQIPVRAEDHPKTAVITHKRLYAVNAMPYEPCNVPATFQRLMDGIFREQIEKDLAAYPDDLLMYALRHGEMLPIWNLTLGQLIERG